MISPLLRLALISLICIPQLYPLSILNDTDESLTLQIKPLSLSDCPCALNSFTIQCKLAPQVSFMEHNLLESLSTDFSIEPAIMDNWNGLIELTVWGTSKRTFMIWYTPRREALYGKSSHGESIAKTTWKHETVPTDTFSYPASVLDDYPVEIPGTILLDEKNSTIVISFDACHSRLRSPRDGSCLNPIQKLVRNYAPIYPLEWLVGSYKDYLIYSAPNSALEASCGAPKMLMSLEPQPQSESKED